MQVILDSSFARPGSAPIWGGKKGEFRDWTNAFNARLKGLIAPHLAEFFPSTVELSLESVAVKKFGKELGTENHNSNQ